ncbi:TetR/AcrR family transcriptional regulator [Mycobacterium sp. ACS4331]|uniref:TetR/AcrR family transcriptional regulator n=1 Tax=Mycobacterium sp. ACS4331 TaxID=1834121 RepID=UPI0007FF624F|nr:TetR/AcrR family transcriptional regulator [Mycobacterium sp. ACS4331]OBF16362.1 TetR family transcriptional regulator [Mycobacterium sp. ACS4331]
MRSVAEAGHPDSADRAQRPYRGVQAGERLARRRQQLIDAGLDLLGQTDPDDLTVRAICTRAGLTARYFYEAFADKDAFVEAVFDAAAEKLATTTQAAVADVAPADQNRAGITSIVRTIAEDPRIGRLLFSTELSNAVILRMRAQRTELFVNLGDRHIQTVLRVGGSSRLKATTNFVLGGLRQTISAWLTGEVAMSSEEFIELLVAIIDDLNNPHLFRE